MMDGLLSRIETLAAEAHASRVTGVSVWLGATCHLSPALFRQRFLLFSGGTCAAGATLDIVPSSDPDHPEAAHVRLLGIDVES